MSKTFSNMSADMGEVSKKGLIARRGTDFKEEKTMLALSRSRGKRLRPQRPRCIESRHLSAASALESSP